MSKKPLGELAVVALKARNLPDREIVGKQDPFCVFRLGDQAKKTKTDHRGGQHPVWDDQVNLVVPEGKTKMTVQLFDEDKRKEDLISEGEVDLATVIRDGEQDDWFPLQYKGRSAGQIYLELTFYSAAAPARPTTQPVRYPNTHPNQMRPPTQPQRPPVQQQRPVQQQQQQQQVPPVGPAPYRPPPPQQPPSQMARPHVPPPLNGPPPQSSNSAPLYPPNRPPVQRHSPPGGFNRPPPPPAQQQPYPSPQQSRPPGAYPSYPPGQPQSYPSPQPPQPPAGYPPASAPQSASLLTAAYNPQSRPPPHAQRPPPQQQYPANPPGGYAGGFPSAPQRPPYPPQGGGGGPPGMSFPEPQHFSNYQPSYDDQGQPFAAHNSPYAPHQQQQPQPQSRPMSGYPPPYPPR
ncbi:hypothetical protein INT43_000730 [Umbelopsis isabellina]|uniref:C2 domain-containing protein n=1 Tax=Mortierella isabellina TaxID=91625 RepID=A0A8H7Q2M9_MORIS|nr:hypothetical protein INT43_000730 [Umbelopsis isabellina]